MLFKEERSEVSEFDWGLTAIGDVADDDSLKASSNEPFPCWFSDLDCLVVEITRSCGHLGCVGVLGCWVLNILVTSLFWGNLASWSGGGCGLLVLQGNCQGVVGAELAVSGSARGATLFVASFNGGGRCFVRATVFVHPLPNEVFVPVTGALGLGRSTGGSGSRTPFRRAAKPGSRPGRGTAPPRATFSPRAPGLPAAPGAARTGPPCKVAAASRWKKSQGVRSNHDFAFSWLAQGIRWKGNTLVFWETCLWHVRLERQLWSILLRLKW